jgi:enoyl-CoA hydratase/carnithine racemase
MSEVYRTIRYERHGDIGTLTLARPGKRNALDPLMWDELAQLGAELLSDETLRCLVVTGEGSTFSAGIDLVEGMAGMLADGADRSDDEDTLAVGLALSGAFSWIPELAGRLAAQPPIAVRGARRAIDAAWYRGPDVSLRLALEEQIRCLGSEDFKEARQAMVDGRSPQWRGR